VGTLLMGAMLYLGAWRMDRRSRLYPLLLLTSLLLMAAGLGSVTT
jgi:hypothetical protein